ncbi:MAG: alkaline phosphatase family protein [bacterium]
MLPIALIAQLPGPKENRMLLPNGWWLSPAGEQLPLGDFPMNAALHESQRYLAVTQSGQSKAELLLVDLKLKKVVQQIRLKDSWLGIKFVGSKLYVSGGYQNCIYTFQLAKGQLITGDTLYFVDRSKKYSGAVAGLDMSKNTLAVVFREDSTLRFFDLKKKQQEIVKLEGMPYTCLFLNDGSLAVSLWSSKKVQVFMKRKMLYEVATGDHPNEITLSKNQQFAYIACANDNTVTVIDLRKQKAVASIVTAIHPDAPEGSTTNSVALTPDQNYLIAANADNNSLAVIGVKKPAESKPLGFIPVGWYPTKVLVLKNNTILVLNGKGGRSFANPKEEYIGSLMVGSLSIIPMPSEKKLAQYSQQVLSNTPYKHSELLELAYKGENAIPRKVGNPSPIKYVFYIIKENRTYDQVFGDMPQGNGDTSLCLFGEEVSPNHHKLAREFVLMDNFYVNAEVSADGHNWSVGGYATDFIEKTWPPHYGGRGGEYVFEGTERTGKPTAGYIWSMCNNKGVSFRLYGEYIDPEEKDSPAKPRDADVGNNFSKTYRGWDLDYSDIERYKAWEKEFTEFERTGSLPKLNILHLPNDHTAGTKKGALTPKAYVAQNDYALGLIVDRISRSPFWKETAIFVVEDDAQNGPDHVDAHRSTALVISPYIKRNSVDHTLYSTTSMLRTMELILGLPPMSQFDAAAIPMYNAFTTTADLTPYSVEQPRHDLNEKNPDGSYGQDLMERMNLRKVDAAPDRLFSEIIWRAVKGTPMPPPKYSIFSFGAEEEDE